MEKEIKKEYSNGDVTVVWKPNKCIHSEICVKSLPNVYKPNEKPWIQVENASTEELKEQVSKCPSGALTYYMSEEVERTEPVFASSVKAQVLPNGPLLVQGTLDVKDKDGNVETKNGTTAFCRCGASQNKPYCDGAHAKIEFKD